jgi:hypothetical protein
MPITMISCTQMKAIAALVDLRRGHGRDAWRR